MSLPTLFAGKSAPGLSAALDLRFALDKSLTAYRGPTPSFSRASTGSYFDGSGVLRYAPVNLVQYSEQFNDAYWVKDNCSISVNSLLAPDGKLTADKVIENSLNNAHYVFRTASYSSGIYTKSVYMKAGERSWGWVYLESGASALAYFNLENGTVGNVTGTLSPSANITNIGNGWYRCSITANVPTNNFATGFGTSTSNGVLSYLGNGTSGIYVWGAQLEASSTVGTYCPTTSSANSAPRFNHTYNGTSWVSKGLLVEEQRTNSAQYSEDLSNAYWTKAGSTISANNANAPDGNLTADKVVETAANIQHTLYNSGFSVTAGSASTVSFYAKAAGRNFIQFPLSDAITGAGSQGRVNFDLSTGTIGQVVGTNLTAEIIDVGNGWYRCVVKSSSAVSSGTGYLQFNLVNSATATPGQAYLGDGSSGVFVWGIQLEAGSAFATSYIPSLSNSSTTRSADVCQITGSDFSGFWNGTEGSIVAEYDRLANNSSGLSGGYPTTLAAASSNNAWIILAGSIAPSPVGEVLAVYNNTSQAYFSAGASPLAGINAKMAACYKANDFAASLNGSAVSTDTSGTVPTCDRLGIGYWPYGNAPLNGHIARLRYFNKRLPNATLQQLST